MKHCGIPYYTRRIDKDSDICCKHYLAADAYPEIILTLNYPHIHGWYELSLRCWNLEEELQLAKVQELCIKTEWEF